MPNELKTRETTYAEGETASLPTLLSQLNEEILNFAQLLDQEHTALTQFTSEALNILTDLLDQKNQSSDRIQQLTQVILKTAAQTYNGKLNLSEPNLQQLLSLPLSPLEQQQLKKNLKQSESVYQKNLRNGMMIQSLSNINQQALMVLKGADNLYSGYTAQGTQQRPTTQNTSLGKA